MFHTIPERTPCVKCIILQSSYVNEAGYTLLQAQFQKLDGTTGNNYPAYVVNPFSSPISLNVPWSNPTGFWPDTAEGAFPPIVGSTDGTIITAMSAGVAGVSCSGLIIGGTGQPLCQPNSQANPGVAVIDPVAGQPKPISFSNNTYPLGPYPYLIVGGVGDWIVAGDGYAYLLYSYEAWSSYLPAASYVVLNPQTGSGEELPACTAWGSNEGGVQTGGVVPGSYTGTVYLALLRVDTSGNATSIPLTNWNVAGNCGLQNGAVVGTPINVTLITNADQGVLATWQYMSAGFNNFVKGQTTTTNYIASVSGTSVVSQNTTPSLLTPVLQAQDGTFFGTSDQGMVRFDQTGNIKWIVGDSPQIATADNGVVGLSGTTYDSSGNATGQVGSLPSQSWTGNAYTDVTCPQFPIT